MKTVWDEGVRQELKARLHALTPAHQRQWGSMTPEQMLAHLTESLRMALGDLPVPSKNLPLRFWPLKQLVIFCMPFPRSAPTAPQLVGRVATDWPAEVARIEALLERFAAVQDVTTLQPHPAFGALSKRAWGVLAYRHTDHHLRQFGC